MTTNKPSLAIVEQDHNIRENLIIFLSSQGYNIWGADSAENLFRKLLVQPTDIILLNLSLPKEGGLSVLQHLQGQKYLFIAISATNLIEDKKAALSLGAKSYLTQPVNMQLLLSHIDNIWKEANTPKPTKPKLNWRLDTNNRYLFAPNGRFVLLTPTEYKLVSGLMANPGKTFTKNEISNFLWEGQSNWRDYHGVEVLLSRLRAKSSKTLDQALPIESVQAIGLKFTTSTM